jgi:hypothetical protein
MQSQRKLTDIADDVETLLIKAYERERDCFVNLSRIELMGV